MTTAMIVCIILLAALFLVGALPGLPGRRAWKDRPLAMVGLALALIGLVVLFGSLR